MNYPAFIILKKITLKKKKKLNLTLKNFSAAVDDSVGIEYSQSGTYRPYSKEMYVTIRAKTTALENELSKTSSN